MKRFLLLFTVLCLGCNIKSRPATDINNQISDLSELFRSECERFYAASGRMPVSESELGKEYLNYKSKLALKLGEEPVFIFTNHNRYKWETRSESAHAIAILSIPIEVTGSKSRIVVFSDFKAFSIDEGCFTDMIMLRSWRSDYHDENTVPAPKS